MRIAHICLANFYIDNFGYQENILTKFHKKMGHEIVIVASTETYIDKTVLGNVEPSSYINEYGIQVHRLPYARWIPKPFQLKIRAYQGLRGLLDTFQPDLIFVHGVQFFDFLVIKSYVKRFPAIVYADSHADYVNSARGFVSRYILHGLLYRWILSRVDPIVHKYFPTLPVRGDFLSEVYGLDRNKMELLPFGVDDCLFKAYDRDAVRHDIRAQYSIPDDAIVFVTGGKLDIRKNIHTLIERFSKARERGELSNVHLIVFGHPNAAVQEKLDRVSIDTNVHMVGWIETSDIFRYFWASDFAIFPGTHSVLWEEAVGHGLGAAFHHWPGHSHLDLGGNAIFINDGSSKTIDNMLLELTANNGAEIHRYNAVAAEKGPAAFSFSAIAAKAIGQEPIG